MKPGHPLPRKKSGTSRAKCRRARKSPTGRCQETDRLLMRLGRENHQLRDLPSTHVQPSVFRPLNLPGRRTARGTGRRGSDSETQEIIDAYQELLNEEVSQ